MRNCRSKTWCALALVLWCCNVGWKKGGGSSCLAAPPADPADPAEVAPETSDTTIYLKQGWSKDVRERFYYLDQGSQLVPYYWFINLELPRTDELLRSDHQMIKNGFIPQGKSPRNPDGLPIGFVRAEGDLSIGIKAADYKLENITKEKLWLGVTCAACHTADLKIGEKVIRIDGGAAMADFESFLRTLSESMRAAADEPDKFAAFAERIRNSVGGGDGAVPSLDEFKSYTVRMEQLVERNKAAHSYGLARLDAFGAILNQITAVALNIPGNNRPASAPVSYPFLWDAPHLDWVQWNSTAEIPIGRNVGQVLGVFGHVELTGNALKGYDSTAHLHNLHDLETDLRSLKAPPWPAEHFGEIDVAKAAAGKALFTANCSKCHNSRGKHGKFKRTKPNKAGSTYIKTRSIPFNKIGTDRQMVVNFVTRTSDPGIMLAAVKPKMNALKALNGADPITELRAKFGLPAPDFSKEAPAGALLKTATRGVIRFYLDNDDNFANLGDERKLEILLDLRGGRPPVTFPPGEAQPPNHGLGYKARPLNGVWATAPYLHNGSVPNLWELLKPENCRIASFHVGSREFDSKHVGQSTEEVADAFHFQTVSDDGVPIPGNSNLGHSGRRYTQTKENGAWRVFTPDEKWAIIEYMKTLE